MSSKKPKSKSRAVDEIASGCLAVRVRLINRAITAIYDEALRPLGVKVSQLNVLVAVAKAGPVSPGALAQRLKMEKSTLSRNVDRMRTRGWIEVSEGDHGRSQTLKIGAAGQKLIEESLPFWKKAQAETETVLGERGSRSIFRAADTVSGGSVST